MRRLGKVLHLSKSGNIILRLESPRIPLEGTAVCDYRLQKVGIVNSILGPTRAPYLSVQPSKGVPPTSYGRVLYILEKD